MHVPTPKNSHSHAQGELQRARQTHYLTDRDKKTKINIRGHTNTHSNIEIKTHSSTEK